MKKLALLFAAIGLISIVVTQVSFAGATVPENTNNKLIEAQYKECIDACDACAASCKKFVDEYSDENDPKMARSIQLCKECSSVCTASSKLMSLNSENAKEMCTVCSKICDKCATECEKFTSELSMKCAADCRKAGKMCKEMM